MNFKNLILVGRYCIDFRFFVKSFTRYKQHSRVCTVYISKSQPGSYRLKDAKAISGQLQFMSYRLGHELKQTTFKISFFIPSNILYPLRMKIIVHVSSFRKNFYQLGILAYFQKAAAIVVLESSWKKMCCIYTF